MSSKNLHLHLFEDLKQDVWHKSKTWKTCVHKKWMSYKAKSLYRLIFNLWALTTLWGKNLMTTIEEMELKELEIEHKRYEYHEHQYTQQVYDELQSLH